jgi:hypothetical protein
VRAVESRGSVGRGSVVGNAAAGIIATYAAMAGGGKRFLPRWAGTLRALGL